MKTAAIIVNHNNQSDLKKLVTRIKDYDVLDAVVIVDNKSDDIASVEDIVSAEEIASAEEVAWGKVVLLKAERNGGYGYGNNIGMRWAYENGFTHAVIANPDTEFSEDCVRAMLDEFSSADDHDNTSKCQHDKDSANTQIAVVAPVCRTPESNFEAPQSGWKLKTWGQELLSKGPVCRRLFRSFIASPDFKILNEIADRQNSAGMVNRSGNSAITDAYNIPEYSKATVDVDAVLGSMLTVDVARFIEVGGYDDSVFLYCEENILGQKMRSHGYKTRLLIDQEYIHNHKPGLPSRQAIRNLTASELYYFEKYLGASFLQLIISKIFFRIIYFEVCLSN